MKITRFEDIEAWQIGRDLCISVYNVVKGEKFSKDYGLKDQVTRASVSIMANIAEGFDAGSRAEFIRFLVYAQRSASELQSEIYVALDQNYISRNEFDAIYSIADKARSKIGAFIKYLKQATKNKERRTQERRTRTTNKERKKMTDIAIRVENLSKQYRIGAHQQNRNFREAFRMHVKAPFRRAAKAIAWPGHRSSRTG